jgi:hypothetical protein
MTLAPGTRLGPDEIVAPIGAGKQWAPVDRGVAFVDPADTSSIRIQPLVGGSSHVFQTFPGKTVGAFAWSPNGKHLAVVLSSAASELADMVLIKGLPTAGGAGR